MIINSYLHVSCHHRLKREARRELGYQRVSLHEPPHYKTNKMTCAPSKDSDQPGHPPRLIRVFADRMKRLSHVSCLNPFMPSELSFQTGLADLSLVTRKPVFGVFDQVWLKPICSAKEASKSHEIANLETRDIILSRQWTTKVLIRFRIVYWWNAETTITHQDLWLGN